MLLSAGHRSREPVERRGEYGGQRGVHPDPAELPEIVAEPLETVADPGAYRCDRSCQSGLRTDGPSEEQREQGSDGHRPQVLVVVAAVLLHLGHHRGKVLGVLAVAPGEQAQDDTADDAHYKRVEAPEIGRDAVPDGRYPEVHDEQEQPDERTGHSAGDQHGHPEHDAVRSSHCVHPEPPSKVIGLSIFCLLI